MRLLPVIYVGNTDASIRFYTALGLDLGFHAEAGDWVELQASGGTLALHSLSSADTGHKSRSIDLCFEADQPLEDTMRRLNDAGFSGGEIVDEDFGRSLRIDDPDGRSIQINESPDIRSGEFPSESGPSTARREK